MSLTNPLIIIIGLIILGVGIYLNRDDFKKKTVELTKPHDIYFKNNIAAFNYAVEYWSPDWQVGKLYIGLVEHDLNEEHILLRVAAVGKEDILAIGFKGNHKLLKGNLIYWRLTDVVDFPEFGKTSPAGIVVATIEPCLIVLTNEWKIRKIFQY